MFHHSLGIQDPCRESSPDSLPLSFGRLGQLLRLPSRLCTWTRQLLLVLHVAQQARIPTKIGTLVMNKGMVRSHLRSTCPTPTKLLLGAEKLFISGEGKGSIRLNAYHHHIHGGNREGRRSPEVHSPFLNQGLIQAVMASWCLSEPRPILSGITTKNKSEPGQGFPAFPVPLGRYDAHAYQLRNSPSNSHWCKQGAAKHSECPR